MSHQNPPDATRVSRIFFYILMFAILGWFTYMQFFGADERRLNVNSDSMIYTGTFTWEKSDGTSEEITVPGRYDLPVGETMVLTTRLPEDYHENTMAIRSSLQDVKFYINGTLRASYNTSETRLAGKNSASRYIFCETSEADAGKELRIELTTHTYNYSGVVNTVLCGDKTDIWLTILNQYGPATYIALFIFFTGLVTILFSLALGKIYHSSFDMEYLGWCMIMGGVWMMGESKLRQILVPNASALGSLCFVMILLCPIPILLYADSIQKQLHRRLYTILGGLALLDFAVCSILTFFGIADYIETLPIGQIILCSILVVVFIHLFIYMHSSRRKSDRLLLLGLLAAIICISIEAISVYFVTSISGLFIGIGMIILLFVNIIRTLRNLQDMELHRQKIEVEKSKQQTERISLQMMQTLATTIEAKDEYTRGHSYRVAEYAALIAKELGWSQDEITNLKHAAHLHDIGKIGIPDSVLNKPTQLTENEDNLLKNHTIIGAEILKDVTLIPHVVEVTRNHHEHYDGSGYPDGLAGTEIPIYARIIAVADCYDAMNSRRIYRNVLSQDEIYEEILKNKGTQFDPEIADIFLTLLTENQIPDLDDFSESSSATHDSVATQMQELFDQFRLAISKDVEIRSATLSAGICMCTAGDNFENCYQKADKALYYVKQNGKNQFFFYQQIDRKELLTSSTGKDLQLVAKSLRESGTYIGAMDLNYRDFARQYEYMSQLSIRSQCHCYLVMVTMETAVDTIPNIEAIEQALECIEKAIRQKIRRVDICTRYSSMQYLIILFEPIEPEIPHIMDRIFMQYRQQCDNTDFRPTYEYLVIAGEKQ
ncbi:HD domain-containing phosphohydrolase [Coprococcus catus]|uniref:HD domain-containing phosphohydrolase n=1 Tax=Coprococcus catus TaxID=116085 RepID=UPI001C02001F|nr:HD domain-containing phosphohydrolase [Coprococcus catus]